MNSKQRDRIAVFDVDNTIVDGFTEWMLVCYLFLKKKLSFFYFLRILFWFVRYKIGLQRNIDLRSKILNSFKGWRVIDAQAIFRDCFNRYIKPKIFLGALQIIEEHAADGYIIILLSNSINPLVNELKNFLSLKHSISTELAMEEGRYTGQIVGDAVYGSNKVKKLKELVEKSNFTFRDSYIYSDHISDLRLLELGDHPVVINPGIKLYNVAKSRGWAILSFSKVIK